MSTQSPTNCVADRTWFAASKTLFTAHHGTDLRFAPDLDQVEALSPERDALWSRLERTGFLTNAEKRAAIGYTTDTEGGDSARGPFGKKFREDQARDDQGRWVDEGGGSSEDDQGEGDDTEDDVSPSETGDPELIDVAARGKGGIPKAAYDWTVRQFVSQYCKGGINEVLPGQFEGISIKDLLDLAKGGDAAARTCVKLLNQGRFRK